MEGERREFFQVPEHMEETVRRVTPRPSLHSVLRQQAVFDGGEEARFFLSSGVYMEWRARNSSKSQSPYRLGRKPI